MDPDENTDGFSEPTVDVDEWRSAPRRHRYVAGHFAQTTTRFTVAMPAPQDYRRRLLQVIEGAFGGTAEYIGPLQVPLSLGAIAVGSNQGYQGLGTAVTHHGGGEELPRPSILNFEASYAAARYATTLATQMYGLGPEYKYLIGGSAGARRALCCLESCDGFYSGAVAYMLLAPDVNIFSTVRAEAMRALHGELDSIIDAMDVGGTGDPWAGLSSQQRETLALLYRAGHPRGSEFLLPSFQDVHGLAMQMLALEDPTYFDDYWSSPGYGGADDPRSRAERDRIDTPITATVDLAAVAASQDDRAGIRSFLSTLGEPDLPVGISIASDPMRWLGSTLTVASGSASGRSFPVIAVVGGHLIVPVAEPGLRDVAVGDIVVLDNSAFLAYSALHRHAGSTDGGLRRLWDVDGRRIFPVRDVPDLLRGAAPSLSGEHRGKAILVQHLQDSVTPPTVGIEHALQVARSHPHGSEDFRLYLLEHAHHLPPSLIAPSAAPVPSTRLIEYDPFVRQGLLDLMAWVEDGIRPPDGSRYVSGPNGAIALEAAPHLAGGRQPSARLLVNHAEAVCVRAGEPLTLNVDLSPASGTKIVRMELDFSGQGRWELQERVQGEGSYVRDVAHAYEEAGTFFPCVRVHARIGQGAPVMSNLARARVVVERALRTPEAPRGELGEHV